MKCTYNSTEYPRGVPNYLPYLWTELHRSDANWTNFKLYSNISLSEKRKRETTIVLNAFSSLWPKRFKF